LGATLVPAALGAAPPEPGPSAAPVASGTAGIPFSDRADVGPKFGHSANEQATSPAVAGYSIQGTVIQVGGGALAGIYVEADSTTNSQNYYIGATSPSGTYSLDGLPNDTYVVFFGDRSGAHFNGFYSGGGVPVVASSASMIPVSGATVAGIDAQLALIAPWTLTIQASATSATVGTAVTITATTNQDITLTNFNVYILRDDDSGWYCQTGTTCDASDWMNTAGTTTYLAILADPYDGSLHSTSGSVTVTWTSLGGSTFVALAPSRLLDTRDGTGGLTVLHSRISRHFLVGGTGGVPANASAVTGNLTVTQQTSLGFLYLGPRLMDDPSSSTLNFPVGDDRANAVTVAVGNSGYLWVTYAAPTLGPTAHVIFDVTGYFVPNSSGATYHALAPTRLLDSRNGTGVAGVFQSHVARMFQVTGAGGVPANATAVTGNLTVTQQSAKGFLYIGPVVMNNPTSSTLNFPLADDRANAVTVALSPTGGLSVTFAAPSLGPTAHVIFDVTGYFTPDMTGSVFMPLTPTRLLDSRDGTGSLPIFNSHVAQTFQVSGGASVVPSVATAVTGNLTVTQQSALGFLYVGPAAMNNPTSSTLNFPLSDDRANSVDVALSTDGKLSVTYAAPTSGPTAHAIFDVTGYFAPATL
jgi:hypothetical protein